MSKGILGKDYVTLEGKGGRDYQNGTTSKYDEFMHLSIDIGSSLICGSAPDKFLITDSDVDITCPKCIKILEAKSKNG